MSPVLRKMSGSQINFTAAWRSQLNFSFFVLWRRAHAATGSRRRGRLDIDNLAQEDIDGQEITVNLTNSGRLIDDDLLSFVNVYFPNEIMAHEAYQVRHFTNPEQNRNGKDFSCCLAQLFLIGRIFRICVGSKIVWVENSQTGDMIPIVRQNASAARRRNQAAGDAQTNVGSGVEDGNEEEALLDLEEGPGQTKEGYLALLPNVPPLPPPLDDAIDTSMSKPGTGGAGGLAAQYLQKQEQEIAPIVSYHNLVMVQRATFLVFQGLLAGFCFTTIFSVQAAVRQLATFFVVVGLFSDLFLIQRTLFYSGATTAICSSSISPSPQTTGWFQSTLMIVLVFLYHFLLSADCTGASSTFCPRYRWWGAWTSA